MQRVFRQRGCSTSLLVIGVTALGSLIQHVGFGTVSLSLDGMIGAYGGGRIAQAFDGKTLLYYL